MAIAGIDIGTTGCKCTVYSTDGRQLNEAYIDYEGVSSEGRELDPAVVWEDVRKVLYTASRDTEPLEAIGVTSFGEAFAMLDENDRPLSNSILYTDTRAEEMCSLLTGKTGIGELRYLPSLLDAVTDPVRGAEVERGSLNLVD